MEQVVVGQELSKLSPGWPMTKTKETAESAGTRPGLDHQNHKIQHETKLIFEVIIKYCKCLL